jgi:hypothetical protein
MENNVRAFLTTKKLGTEEVIGYVTTNYDEVYQFKVLCQHHNMEYSVRFKKVDKNDPCYWCNGVKKSIFRKIKEEIFA